MTLLTRQQLVDLIRIMDAAARGEVIQAYQRADGTWADIKHSDLMGPDGTIETDVLYRVKSPPARARRYLRALRAMSTSAVETHVGVVNYVKGFDPDVFARNTSGFIRWIDSDWQEVQV